MRFVLCLATIGLWLVWSVTWCSGLMDLVGKYTRPITILDLRQDDSVGHDAWLLERGAVVVVLCANEAKVDTLLKLSDKNRLIICRNVLTAELTKLLAECEHFDIVLAPQSYEGIQRGLLLDLGDYTCFCLGDLMQSRAALGDWSCQVCQGTRKVLTRRNVFWGLGALGKKYLILSSFDKKELVKTEIKSRKKIKSTWLPGINLLTFLALDHVYPTKPMVMRAVNELTTKLFDDWGPANMIISGHDLTLIDQKDFYGVGQGLRKYELNRRLKLIDLLFDWSDFTQKKYLYWTVRKAGKCSNKDKNDFRKLLKSRLA